MIYNINITLYNTVISIQLNNNIIHTPKLNVFEQSNISIISSDICRAIAADNEDGFYDSAYKYQQRRMQRFCKNASADEG